MIKIIHNTILALLLMGVMLLFTACPQSYEGNKLEYFITVTQPSEGGTISSDKNKAEAGETITITASPATGWILSGLSVFGANVKINGNIATFIMPSNNVTVTAWFDLNTSDWETVIKTLYPGAYALDTTAFQNKSGSTIIGNVISWNGTGFHDVTYTFPASLNLSEFEAVVMVMEIFDITKPEDASTQPKNISINMRNGSANIKTFIAADNTGMYPYEENSIYFAGVSGSLYTDLISDTGFDLQNNVSSPAFRTGYKIRLHAMLLLPKRSTAGFGKNNDEYVLDPADWEKNSGATDSVHDLIIFNNSGSLTYTFPADVEIKDYNTLVIDYRVIYRPQSGNMSCTFSANNNTSIDLTSRFFDQASQAKSLQIYLTDDVTSGFTVRNNPGLGNVSRYIIKINSIKLVEVDMGISAVELVEDIRVGWNLGNTLDWRNMGGSNTLTVNQLETGWNNPTTTQTHFTALKNAGFNAVRLPVTWTKAIDANYNIRPDWIIRIKEIVGYALNENMYVILNTHHDEYRYSRLPNNAINYNDVTFGIFGFRTYEERDESLPRFKKIWEQISEAFKDFDDRLIFEGLNEPRVIGSPNEWMGGTPTEIAVINEYYQVFVDAVRASGGNNNYRVLVLNTHAASRTAAAANGLKLPVDTIPGKIIVSFHSYVPNAFALDGTVTTWSASDSSNAGIAQIHDGADRFYDLFVSKGIPVIIGEFGATHVNINNNNPTNNEAIRAAWAEYYVNYAASKGIKCFWWDDGGWYRLYNRRNNNFHFPLIVDGLMKGTEK